jgi:hypothetical protein
VIRTQESDDRKPVGEIGLMLVTDTPALSRS